MSERVRIPSNLVVAAVLGLTLLSLPAFGEFAEPVIVANGGFELEADDGSGPFRWNATRPELTRDSVVLEWEKGVYYTGSRSVSIAIKESHPDSVIAYSWNRPLPGFRMEATYQVTGWVKTQDLKSTPFIVLQCWNQNMEKMLAFASTQDDYNLTGTNDWTQVKTTITLPRDTWRFMILAGIMAPENRGGKVWFDDILYERISEQQ
jgi:hypothetical protein